jgi:hypothetical protein
MKKIKSTVFMFFVLFSSAFYLIHAQNMVTYCGAGEQTFNDVIQISNGDLLVVGRSKNISWVNSSVPQVVLTQSGITNTLSNGNISFILQLSSDATIIKRFLYLPANTSEGFRFIKTTNKTGNATGDIFISGETSGGYFIGKLNNNFVNGIPSGFTWVYNVDATSGSYPKVYQPWDVGTDGKVIYASGDSHSTSWSEIARLKTNGTEDVVNNWTTHWPLAGGEYYGLASNYPGASGYSAGVAGINNSAIVFKKDNRCNLRSQNSTDFNAWSSDGNGGTKKGKWPLDAFFSSHCTPGSGPTSGPGYTGYKMPSGTITYGPSSIVINRNNNNFYFGFNTKSILPEGLPDFEPAVVAMNQNGELLWWSRLYHEKRADNSLWNSTPDQYIDDLAIDYSSNQLVVVARCHGNNSENFWEGNTVANNSSAYGFQNRFTGTSGNIHLQWIGKLSLNDGTFNRGTYMAEYAEGGSGFGSAHSNPNLDGFPDPNQGWATLNTTGIVNNTTKVTSDGSVLVLGKGRRTITTANAYQKMPIPSTGLKSCWNRFVRLYKNDLTVPLYSSLLVGAWDTANETGGDNVRLNGVFKTSNGIIAVGHHTGSGNELPLSNVPTWGRNNFNSGVSTSVFAYLDTSTILNASNFQSLEEANIFPNPSSSGIFNIVLPDNIDKDDVKFEVLTIDGKLVSKGSLSESNINSISIDQKGIVFLRLYYKDQISVKKLINN